MASPNGSFEAPRKNRPRLTSPRKMCIRDSAAGLELPRAAHAQRAAGDVVGAALAAQRGRSARFLEITRAQLVPGQAGIGFDAVGIVQRLSLIHILLAMTIAEPLRQMALGLA